MKYIVVLLTMIILAVGVGASCNPTSTADYVVKFNQYRNTNGLQPLTFTDDLKKVAQLRLKEIQSNYSHTSQGGYNQHLEENIVKGVHNNREALSTWKKSPGDRANMLNPGYQYTGYATGDGYAVQLFAEYPTVNGEPQLPSG